MSERLYLRTVKPDGTSRNGYKWPLEVGAVAECPDWNPEPVCGGGLHAIDALTGNWDLLDWSLDAVPLVIKAKDCEVVEIDAAKIKMERAEVIEVGEPGSLYDLLCRMSCDSERINELVETASAEAGADDSQLAASGDGSQLAASGDYSKLAASGYDSQLAASGYDSQLAASGDGSQLAASGYDSQLAASGDDSKLAASGDCSKLAASGDCSKLAASGNDSKLAASGDCSKLAASGDGSKLAASGNDSQLAASGNYSKLAASGYCSQLAASGDYSQLAASGDYSQLAASGDYSLILAFYRSRAKTGERGCIALAWWDAAAQRPRVSVGYAGEGLKPHTWYRLNERGEFVEVEGNE